MTTMVLEVDDASMETLQVNDFQIHYGFGQIIKLKPVTKDEKGVQKETVVEKAATSSNPPTHQDEHKMEVDTETQQPKSTGSGSPKAGTSKSSEPVEHSVKDAQGSSVISSDGESQKAVSKQKTGSETKPPKKVSGPLKTSTPRESKRALRSAVVDPINAKVGDKTPSTSKEHHAKRN